MAGFGAGAGNRPERKRGLDEVTSDDYHHNPVGHAPFSRHQDARPWMHQYPSEMVPPCTCDQEGLAIPCTTSQSDSDVAQGHVFGPLAQPYTVLNTMYGAQSSSHGFVSYEQPGFSPTMSFNASPYYTELPITGSASCEYTGPLYDASVVTNATPDTSNAHNGLSYVQPSVFISPQTSSDMTVPAATLTSTQNLQTQARLLPLAPRPSAVPPVVPQDTTPAGTFSCIGTRIRRRYNSEGLSKVNQVREDGACLRCKLYRIGCDKERPCSACQKISGSAKIYRGPCINPRLDTVQAFRAGDGDNGTFIPTLPNLKWVSQTQTARSRLGATCNPVLGHQSGSSLMPATSMTIEITWPFNADIISKCPVTRIDLDRFEPNGQSLAEEWTPVNASETRIVELPPLACRDTEAASKAIESFLDECQRPLEQHISGMLHDPVLKMTWTEILRVRDTSRHPALISAIRMYAAVLMNTRYPKSVRANIFDVAEEPEPPFFFEGNLLPPQLTYQIQMLIAQSQVKMQSDVIRALKRLMFPKRHAQWYMVFLITFVLLSCIELMHHNQTSFLQLKRKNSEANRINVSNVTRHMLREWEDSAENLINHFRYVTRGNIIFSQQGSSFDRNLTSSKLDTEAEAYIKSMREVMSGRIGEMLGMRESRKGTGERQNMWAICELFLPEDSNSP